jgi:hypothetical protein
MYKCSITLNKGKVRLIIVVIGEKMDSIKLAIYIGQGIYGIRCTDCAGALD